ncbi:hypothetical protein SOPP22_02020 [Shewanella sp. OPT22]|nr:hypothetical protein SOPP22_02020 [Shewanella sp. OPT22]
MNVMQKEMNWGTMKDQMSKIYLDNYTEKEIKDMITFYESETGRSMVKKMPKVMTQSMQLSQQMVMKLMPKIQKMSQEFSEKLKVHRSKTQEN